MMYEPTKKEIKEQLKEIIKFCKENYCLMYNYMLTIKQIRKEPEDKLMYERLKKQVRKRDNYRCQECFRHQNELTINTKAGMRPYRLHIHHIDYDKKNNDEGNLISLCKGCHMQTNFDRKDWTNYFQNKL